MKKAARAFSFLALVCAAASVPAFAGSLYTNTDTNQVPYDVSAFNINTTSYQPYAISDSFTLSANSTVNSVSFVVWLFSGDSLQSVDWSIGTTAFSGTGTLAATSGIFDETNGIGYSVYTETFDVGSLSLSAGTYWLTLDGALSNYNNGTYWDESNGASQAEGDLAPNTSPATIGSESFSIDGTAVVTPEPSSFLLLGSGLAGLAGMIRRRLKG
jgi:hypothetical protein